jgi:uncharacterized protein YbjT (DUF2867 family)
MIIITTPTGDIGHQVLENVLQSGEAVRVIARDPSRLPTSVRERVEVVQGSHGDAEVVNRAFAGADAVFWLRPPAPQAPSLEAAYLDFTRPACDAIKRHGVKRVVGVSNLGRGSALAGQAGIVTASLAMDDLLAGTGANFRALTLPTFMDNLRREVDSIKNQGLFSSFLDGDQAAPKCATRDIAATAARLLLDSSWSGQGHLAVLGPEDLSFNDMAHIMSEVLEKPVRYEQIPFDALKARLLQSGMSPAFAAGYVEMMVAKNNGLDNAEPRTPENTTPTSFRQWCEEVLKPAVLA